MRKILKLLDFDYIFQDKIGEPPWDYDFLLNLDEEDYPRYLEKVFRLNTGEKLPLSRKLRMENGKWSINYVINKDKCKTFNQKLQWIKLYGITDLMRQCTDKVAVRDYVKEKIGEEYLKPVLQVIPDIKAQNSELVIASDSEAIRPIINKNSNQLDCHAAVKAVAARNDGKIDDIQSKQYRNNDVSTYFDQIQFDKLPNSFVMKCNHGCKWHYVIKNKNDYLRTENLMNMTKRQMTGWLEQEYWCWNGFEMQYKGIEPKILIEPLMRDEQDIPNQGIHVYCFNSIPKFIIKLCNSQTIAVYDENLNPTEDIFEFEEHNIILKTDENIIKAVDLSQKLAENFYFVRIDWMLYNGRLFFEEMTFTPYSGFKHFENKENNIKLGSLINLKEVKNEF